ncbi:hypothetical protein [Marinilactibacillus sp. Marseille-P9653]|uniref:hypothetical protein n=1 Tax=Marinilactibacillus sp. Marseille-P9653 TaxID=2866583 RepID=UPI001CE3EBD7|nr:hypothetical protein [Marinilactibacillus sp. Marseille-P9653]
MSDQKMQVIVKSYDKTELRIEMSVEEGQALIENLNDNYSVIVNLLAKTNVSKLNQADYNALWAVMRDKQREFEIDYTEKIKGWTNEQRLRFAGYTDENIKDMLAEHPDEDPEEVFSDEISYWE